MLHDQVNSEKDDVKCSSSPLVQPFEKSVHDNSDDYKVEELIDLSIRDVGQAVSKANNWASEAKVDSDMWSVKQNSEKKQKAPINSFASSDYIGGSSKETISRRSHPIPLAKLTDIEDFSQIRVVAEKPLEEMKDSLSVEIVQATEWETDDEQLSNYQNVNFSNLETSYLGTKNRRSVDPGTGDDKSSKTFSISLGSLNQQINEISESGGLRSSSFGSVNVLSTKLTVAPHNGKKLSVILPIEQRVQPLVPDLSVNLRDVQLGENNIEEHGDETAEEYEVLTTKQNDKYEKCSAQSGEFAARPSTMSITRKGDRTEKKLTTSVMRKFDLLQVGQTNFPQDENKRTPLDPYARSIAEISDQLAQFLPEKPWPSPSVDRSWRRCSQGERSVTRSVSTAAPALYPSSSEIFNSVLVNEISKEHSYLKRRDNSKVSRNWRSYKVPRWYEEPSSSTPFNKEPRTVARSNHPYYGTERNRFPEIEKPTEEKSWFYSILSNVSLSPFI